MTADLAVFCCSSPLPLLLLPTCCNTMPFSELKASYLQPAVDIQRRTFHYQYNKGNRIIVWFGTKIKRISFSANLSNQDTDFFSFKCPAGKHTIHLNTFY